MSDMYEALSIPPPPFAGPRADVKALSEIGTPQAEVIRLAGERAYRRVEDVSVFRCECLRCGKVWHTLQQTKPKTCPGCKNAWWDRPKTVNVRPRAEKANGSGVALGRRKKVKGGKKGRPRKDAGAKLDDQGRVAVADPNSAEIPDIPMEVLGALGGLETPSVEVGGPPVVVHEEPFPVPTPYLGRIFLPHQIVDQTHTAVQAGQPADVGRRPDPPVEASLPAPPATQLEPTIEEPLPHLDDDEDYPF